MKRHPEMKPLAANINIICRNWTFLCGMFRVGA